MLTPEDIAQITAIAAAAELRIEAAEQRIVAATQAAIRASEDRAQEFTRGIETSLLTAFHGHAKG